MSMDVSVRGDWSGEREGEPSQVPGGWPGVAESDSDNHKQNNTNVYLSFGFRFAPLSPVDIWNARPCRT